MALGYGLKFVIRNPQVAFGVGNAVVIELVHDKRQVYPAHASMIAPGLPQTVGAEITSQSHFLTDRCDESVLLALEETPQAKEVINRVFRALHTIKGSGGACGFDAISRFAHQVETVYDAIRNDKMTVTREIINLTLAARDQIAALFDEFYRKKPAENEVTEQIINRFRSLLPDGLAPRPAGPSAAAPAAAPVERPATYRIRFRPARNIFLTGNNPHYLLDELRALGACRVVAQLGEIPPLEALDPELCYVYWDVILTTDKGVNAIKDVFIFVQDASELAIETIDADATLAEDKEYNGWARS